MVASSLFGCAEVRLRCSRHKTIAFVAPLSIVIVPAPTRIVVASLELSSSLIDGCRAAVTVPAVSESQDARSARTTGNLFARPNPCGMRLFMMKSSCLIDSSLYNSSGP
eukprot:526987-Prymnesium_polylepis.3